MARHGRQPRHRHCSSSHIPDADVRREAEPHGCANRAACHHRGHRDWRDCHPAAGFGDHDRRRADRADRLGACGAGEHDRHHQRTAVSMDSVRETNLDALASDIDTAIDRSLARVSVQLVGAPSSTPGVDQPTDERMAAARFGALALRASMSSGRRSSGPSDPRLLRIPRHFMRAVPVRSGCTGGNWREPSWVSGKSSRSGSAGR